MFAEKCFQIISAESVIEHGYSFWWQVYDARHVQAKSDKRAVLQGNWKKYVRSRLASHLEIRPGFTKWAHQNPMQKWMQRSSRAKRFSNEPIREKYMKSLRFNNVFGDKRGQTLFKNEVKLTSWD